MPQYLALAALDEGRDGGHCLRYCQHADDMASIHDGRGHMHHRALLIERIGTRTACAVLALQRQVDIVPARIVFAHILILGIKHHDAMRIGDGDAVIKAGLAHPADLHIDAAPRVILHAAEDGGMRQIAGPDIFGHQLRQ